MVKKMSTQGGFTLVELLTTVSIVGILAAISIQQYTTYKARAFDRRAQLDLRNAAVAEEAYFSQHQVFKDCNQSTCSAVLEGLGPLSSGVVLNISTSGANFNGQSSHPKGSGAVFYWP